MQSVLRRVFTHKYRTEAVKRELSDGLEVPMSHGNRDDWSIPIQDGYARQALACLPVSTRILCNR